MADCESITGLENIVVDVTVAARDGAAANVTLDNGDQVKAKGKKGAARCDDGKKAQAVVVELAFCYN